MLKNIKWNLWFILFISICIFVSDNHLAVAGNRDNGQRVQDKISEMQRLLPGWVSSGGNKERIQKLVGKMSRHFDKGKAKKGEAVLDEILSIIKGEKNFDAPNADVKPVSLANLDEIDSRKWILYEANPIFERTKAPKGGTVGYTWGDPSIMEYEGGYRMWLSRGKGRMGVKIFLAESTDGVNWELLNDGKAVIEPTPGTFDAIGVETPAVVKAKDGYHMYYTSFRDKVSPMGVIGHAVSLDGIHWTKKGELTSITNNVGNSNGNQWGWPARAEPSIVYHNDTFYLYHFKPRCRANDCKSGYPPQQMGIGLATSKDGHNFIDYQEKPVILQSENRKASDGWQGHITSWALHDSEMFHVYVDACKQPPNDGRTGGESQPNVAIDHWTSEDGIHFKEAEINIVTKGMQSWANEAVWGPTVLHKKDGTRMMWFYATNSKGGMNNKDIRIGIGMALYKP